MSRPSPSIWTRLKAAGRVLAGYHLQEWSPNRRYWVNRSQPAHKDIPYAVRSRLLDWSREMERKDPLFNRYLDLCEQYIVGPTGLRITSGSQDAAWAERANAAWEAWQPYHDIASLFSFGQRQALIAREVRVAGELFILKTTGSTNRPRIQYIEAENCATPPGEMKREGEDIFDGVRRDSTGRPVSYFFKEERGTTVTWREVPAEFVIHLFDPSRFGQSRGLPVFYAAVRDLLDLSELQELEMVAAKDNASISKVIETATGELDAESIVRMGSADVGDGNTEYYKEILGAETKVIKSGDKYQEFRSERPSVAVQAFWDYVSARAAAGLGIPLEILILKSLQGTMTRAALDMANGYFRAGSAQLADHFGRIWEFVIGSDPTLRQGQPRDWRKIRYTPPRAINVDVGRNSQAMLAELEAGTTDYETIYAALGLDWKEQFRKLKEQQDYAQEIGLTLATFSPPAPQPESFAPTL